MSTTDKIAEDDATAAEVDDAQDESIGEEYEFTPKLPPSFALNLEQVAAVALFGALYVLLNFIPLRATDIWGHVMYGQYILDHHWFPSDDPWMPLAKGMQIVDTAWLSQVIFGAVDRYLGEHALSHLFALVNLAAYIIFCVLFYQQTRRVWLSVACTGLLIFIGWSRFATIRPESFALLCFAVLMLLVMRLHGFAGLPGEENSSRQKFDYWSWVGIPSVMLLWANLHGSFAVGLVLLACLFAGRVVEVAWQTRSARAVLSDRATRRWLFLLEISAAATLLNPLGLDLWIHTATFSFNPNLVNVLEWEPLVVFGVGGQPFAISIVLLLIVWRQSQRSIRPAEVILLLVFGFAAIKGIRMLGWYAPVFVAVVAPHIANIVAQWFPALAARTEGDGEPAPMVAEDTSDVVEEVYELPPGQSFRYSLVAVLLIWIAFALSPSSAFLLKKTRTRAQLMGSETPLALTAYLNDAYRTDATESLPGGQVFHPQVWGDWLKHDGPDEFQAFMTTNIHLVPQQVWLDYQRVAGLSDGWQRVLDRYNVTTVIVDRKDQATFYRTLKRNEEWNLKYEDDMSAVFVRASASAGAREEQPPADNLADRPSRSGGSS